jgi:hypothetical protein
MECRERTPKNAMIRRGSKWRFSRPFFQILNPMDARSAVWDLRDVVQSPLLARHLATLLVPAEKGTGAWGQSYNFCLFAQMLDYLELL